MSFTYDLTTAVGKVRLLIPDKDQANAFFTDEELAAYLNMEDDNIFLAAALALESMASDEVIVLKVVKVLDVQTNGEAVSRALLARADKLRDRAFADDNTVGIASMSVNGASAMDIWLKDELANA